MKFYEINQDNLDLVRTNKPMKYIAISFAAGLLMPMVLAVSSPSIEVTYESKPIILRTDTSKDKMPMTKENVARYIYALNIEHPKIVLAQAILESGHFKSVVAVKNNNIFGMREAKQRVTTATGTQLNHAKYSRWQESVMDYGLYQASYLKGLTESEYWSYLEQHYSETPGYTNLLKQIYKNL
jgi:hypothetical protein